MFSIKWDDMDLGDVSFSDLAGSRAPARVIDHENVAVRKAAVKGTVEIIADMILEAKGNLVFLTGAGMSAASDIPTFRDPDHGVWATRDPKQCGTKEAFVHHPERLWTVLMDVVGPENDPKPNLGHKALGDLEALGFTSTVVTQNVDDLHENAGNKDVMHLHGNLWRTFCVACGLQGTNTHELLRTVKKVDLPPRCDHCHGVLKPDAILFGELLDNSIVDRASDLVKHTPLLFVLGTSARVTPASDFPIMAANHGAKVVEINMERTQLTDTCVDVFMNEPLEVVLPQIVELVRQKHLKKDPLGTSMFTLLSSVLNGSSKMPE
ncbi:hypothetical protein SARC_09063 [Sphaeroforma arctica JP610]|uniref:Deacetylase sirtuin-type domain-containing protein n=1 Tax=Sphaeroforma arctica JP610 TaxID=667725 RepID=A0A0L0FNU2_9EUKA|nr:hypothetical protein SARC_09063 [Sphaeroforma arctica JP610]KNC78505.1 hypothetical protein SARC_09063 [Sphaeroforma arctica JP610]|eukprot:XP_014152407.1 hypothetical protein SARC_09063 [Sphaeroforma arctica JP610]